MCVSLTILYESKTWYLRERQVELLRTKRAKIRAMHAVKPIDRKNRKELMLMLGVTVPIERMVRVAIVRWNRHVLQREKGNVLKEAVNFEATGRRKNGRPKDAWKNRLKL